MMFFKSKKQLASQVEPPAEKIETPAAQPATPPPPPAAPGEAQAPAPAAAPTPAPAAAAAGPTSSAPSPAIAPSAPAAASAAPATPALDAAAALGRITSVLMRSEAHQSYRIADLQWLAAPAIASGQFAIAEARTKDGGARAPVAFVIWASVSSQVDERLAATIDQPVKLQADEWQSGDIAWLVNAAGEPRAVATIIKNLLSDKLAGRALKMRRRGPDGKAQLHVMRG